MLLLPTKLLKKREFTTDARPIPVYAPTLDVSVVSVEQAPIQIHIAVFALDRRREKQYGLNKVI